MALKQFTVRDVVSKWDVIEARHRATATTAKEFIETLEQRMPFKVKALQVDGGSEFYSDFEQECQRRKIRLFVLPRRVQSSMGVSKGPTEPIPRSSMRYTRFHGMSPN